MLVVGDIGGTKTAMALYGPGDDPRAPRARKEYPSAAYADLVTIVRAFLAETGQAATHACFDVAGPVIGGVAHVTNLPWKIQDQALVDALGLRRVVLLNDLQAVALAIPRLGPADYVALNDQPPEPRGPIAVIAPGTGLGEAFLVWGDAGYIACASEGGHASFAPTEEREVALWRFLHGRFGAVSFERVCSGMGIANIYDFLCAEGQIPESSELTRQLAGAADRTPLIARAAEAGDPLAAAAMAMFVSILAAEAGNLALKVMATGGVYLAGGVPGHVLPLLRDAAFTRAFAAKGRLGPVLQRMPLRVVTVPAALFGAAQYGLELIGAEAESRKG